MGHIQSEYTIIGVIGLIALNAKYITTIIKCGGTRCFKREYIILDGNFNIKSNRCVDKTSRKRLFYIKTEQNQIIYFFQKPLLVPTFLSHKIKTVVML